MPNTLEYPLSYNEYEFRIHRILRQDLDETPGVIVLDNKREPPQSKVLLDPDDLAQYFRARFWHEDRESFLVASINARNRIIGYEVTAIGSLTEVSIGPPEVFRAAMLVGAAGILVAHNHLSGETAPSEQDDELTKRLCRAGRILRIPVVDHLIVTDKAYYSYATHDKIPPREAWEEY